MARSVLASLMGGALVPGSCADDRQLTGAVEQAAGFRLELAADLTFQAVDTGRVPRAVSVRALEGLYHRAAEAKQKHAYLLTPLNPRPVKAEQFESETSDFGYDAGNLRVRALKRLADVDPRLSRRLFETMPVEPLTGADGCDGRLIPYRGRRYLETLWRIMPADRSSVLRHVTTPQDAAALLGVLTGDEDPAARYEVAVTLGRALGKEAASDRAFVAVEAALGLGQKLEKRLSESYFSPGMASALAAAYAGFVARQLGAERCADHPMADGKDLAVSSALESAQRLEARYGLPRRVEEAPVPRLSRLRPPTDFYDPAAGLQKIAALAGKLRLGGAPGVAAELERELRAYVQPGAAPVDEASGYPIAARIGALVALVGAMASGDVAAVAFPEAGRLLEDRRLRERNPGTWILLVRQAFNLTRHPEGAVSSVVRQFFDTTGDTEIAAFVQLQRVLGATGPYQEDPLSLKLAVAY